MGSHFLRETEEDRKNQRLILSKVPLFAQHEHRETPKLTPHDFEFIEPLTRQVAGIAEVKKRKGPLSLYKRYGDIMLAESKFQKLCEASKKLSVPWYFIVGLDDCVVFYEFESGDESRIPVEYGGRTAQTRDPGDIENVRKIPIGRFRDVSKEKAPGKNPPVLAIAGDEDLLRRRAVKAAVEYNRKNGWQVEYIDASQPGAFEEALAVNPFMDEGSAQKMVVVTNPEKADLDFLKEHAEKTESSHVLLLDIEGKPAGNTKFGKWCATLGKNLRLLEKPKPYQATEKAVEFCVTEAKARGQKLPEGLAAALVDVAGTDLGVLSFEVLKICMLAELDGVSEISRDHAKGGMAPLNETPVSSVRDALQLRNKTTLVRALTRLRKSHKGDPTMSVTRALTKEIMSWVSLSSLLARGMTAEDISIETGLNAWYLKNKLLPNVRRWGTNDLDRLVCAFAEAERAVLNGAVNPWIVLNVRLLEACG